MKSVRDALVKNKKVLLRVDFNVPFTPEGKIADFNRIKAAIPTIQLLLENEAKIIICSHVGRPKGKFDSNLSTLPMAHELSKLIGQKVFATDHILGSQVQTKVGQLKAGDILVLGNLRYDSREDENDKAFAQELASYADIFVNDAFGVSHRKNASIDAITEFLPSYSGLLLESEIETLGFLLNNPEPPFVLIVGGAKVKDKAGMLENLAGRAEKVLIGGAVANTFFLALGNSVGASLVDHEMIQECKSILEKFGDKIILPVDSVKEEQNGTFRILDIGPETRSKFASEIGLAKSVFWNGNMGYTEDPKYQEGTKAVAEAMIKNENTRVVAGGDTVSFVDANGMQGGFSFISTGGGASMQFLSGDPLPGIQALERSKVE